MRVLNSCPIFLTALLWCGASGCNDNSTDNAAELSPVDASTSEPTPNPEIATTDSTGAGPGEGVSAIDSGIGTVPTESMPSVDAGTYQADAGRAAEGMPDGSVGAANDAGPDAGTLGSGPTYAIYGTRYDPWNSPIPYVAFLDSLKGSSEVDPGQLVELPYGITQFVVGHDRDGIVFLADGSSPVMRKYRVDQGGEMVLLDELSFAELGWPWIPLNYPTIVASSTRAYTFSRDEPTAVAWNPQDMTLEGAVALEGLGIQDDVVAGGYDSAFVSVAQADGRIAYVLNYGRGGQYVPSTRIAFIDPSDDSYVVTETPSPCAIGVGGASVNEAGDLYLSSSLRLGLEVAAGNVVDPSVTPCMVRVLAGETEFDPSYFVDLSELSGSLAGGLFQGSGDAAYLRVRHPETPPLDPAFPVTVELFRSNWDLYRVELGNEVATYDQVDLMGSHILLNGGARLDSGSGEVPFVVTSNADLGFGSMTSTAFDLSDPASATPMLDVPGLLLRVQRIR